jgi:hypothetical protein
MTTNDNEFSSDFYVKLLENTRQKLATALLQIIELETLLEIEKNKSTSNDKSEEI